MIEFDEERALREARKVLKNYRVQKERYQKLEPVIKSPHFGERVKGGIKQDRIADWADAGREIKEIERAINSLSGYGIQYSLVLQVNYDIQSSDKKRDLLEEQINYSKSGYTKILRKAQLMFADSYKNSQIAINCMLM